jgi:hypothetical protein
MFLSRRPLQLFCRLLLALWVFACVAGSIEGCLAEGPPAPGHSSLSASPSDELDPAQTAHHAGCQSFCASLGSATIASHAAEAAPLPTPLQMLWLVLPLIIPSLFRHCRACRPLQTVWPATLRPPFLLFQRFNN